MKIFGTVYNFFDFDKGTIVGLKVSILEFFKALSRYSSFDQIHLYINDPTTYSRFKEILENLEFPQDQLKRIFPFLAMKLPENLSKYDYTVFFHGDPAMYSLSYIRSNLCETNSFPVSCLVHDLSALDIPNFFLRMFLADFYHFDRFICPSKAVKIVLANHISRMRQFIKERTGKTLNFPPKLVVLPLGVETEKFKPLEKDKARNQLKLPPDKIIIISTGRLTPYFKMDLFPLLQVTKKVWEISKNKNILLLIIGQEQLPGYAENLRKMAHELGLDNHVLVIDKFENRQIPTYLAASDIFVSPSDNIQETFGLTPIEALAAGLPVVITDWNGYRENVTEAVTGFKIPTIWGKVDKKISEIAPVISHVMAPQFVLAESIAFEVDQMAEVLKNLIENHNLRKKMGQAGRQYALENFSWRAIIKQYENLWEKQKGLQRKTRIKINKEKIWLEKMPFFNFYKHYPTKLIDGQTRIKATPEGKNYLEKEKLPIMEENICRLGNPAILREVLDFCLNDFQPIDEFFKQFKIKDPLAKEIYFYQILFMLKHNLIAIPGKTPKIEKPVQAKAKKRKRK